jgi:hypothetical protein
VLISRDITPWSIDNFSSKWWIKIGKLASICFFTEVSVIVVESRFSKRDCQDEAGRVHYSWYQETEKNLICVHEGTLLPALWELVKSNYKRDFLEWKLTYHFKSKKGLVVVKGLKKLYLESCIFIEQVCLLYYD